MSTEGSEPAVRALAAEVARRVARGECPNAVRAELLADGLPVALVDGLLVGAQPRCRRIGSAVALVVVTVVALPIAGAVAGAWVAWPSAPDGACGMWVFGALFLAGVGAAVGFGAGAALAYATVCGLVALADRDR